MKYMHKTTVAYMVFSAVIFAGGCLQQQKITEKSQKNSEMQLSYQKQPLLRVADVGKIVNFNPVQLRGYGLVTGLSATGSSQCPEPIKNYLIKYISVQLSPDSKLNLEKLISSENTAVVSILGLLPPGADSGERFDVVVSALSSSQTTSLAGGRLMPAELKVVGNVNIDTPALAIVEGAVFSGTTADNKKIGYVLNGGKVKNRNDVVIKMDDSNFVLTSNVRDSINDRFSKRIAVAVSENQINLSVPNSFATRKIEFLKLIQNIYINRDVLSRRRQIGQLIEQLSTASDKSDTEYGLWAIGKTCQQEVEKLLNSPDDAVKFSAAKTLLRIGDSKGYQLLVDIALDNQQEKQLRIEAVNVIGYQARLRDAVGVMTRLLGDKDLDIGLLAYNHLRRLDDVTVPVREIETYAGKFELSRIAHGKRPVIWASISGKPKIVIFSAPLYCNDNLFVELADGNLIANSRSGDSTVTLARKEPMSNRIITIKCPNELGAIISKLGQMPKQKIYNNTILTQKGLGLSYCQILNFVKLMIDKNAVDADLILGDEPELKKFLKFK